jgi:hypothetical protein
MYSTSGPVVQPHFAAPLSAPRASISTELRNRQGPPPPLRMRAARPHSRCRSCLHSPASSISPKSRSAARHHLQRCHIARLTRSRCHRPMPHQLFRVGGVQLSSSSLPVGHKSSLEPAAVRLTRVTPSPELMHSVLAFCHMPENIEENDESQPGALAASTTTAQRLLNTNIAGFVCVCVPCAFTAPGPRSHAPPRVRLQARSSHGARVDDGARAVR